MDEYIKRESAIEAIMSDPPDAHYQSWYAEKINEIPAADVDPLVRCKDCKYGDWDSEPHDAMVCMRTKDGFWRSGNDFCSYGERRSDE